MTWKAAQVAQPRLVKLNRELAEELGLDADASIPRKARRSLRAMRHPRERRRWLRRTPATSSAASSPQLGDGRALLLGEVIDRNGRRRDIQLKGSGPTPFRAPATAGQHSGPCPA